MQWPLKITAPQHWSYVVAFQDHRSGISLDCGFPDFCSVSMEEGIEIRVEMRVGKTRTVRRSPRAVTRSIF